jgi:hypothetical protein
MALIVCPTTVVNAAIERVWAMLTDPDSYQRWADAELVRASPQGPVREAQVLDLRTRELRTSYSWASYAFRPLLIPCLLVAIAYLYAAGRFGWHVRRNARNRQMAIARTHANLFLKLVAQYPVAAGLLMTVAWVVLGVAAVDLLRRTNG